MTVLTRRLFIGASTAVLVAACSPKPAEAPAAATPKLPKLSDAPAAPVARVEPVNDTYFGETVTDNYRWMENYQDKDWLPYLKGQNARTRAVLDAIPGRDKLLERIKQVSGEIVLTSGVQDAGGVLFYQQRPAGSEGAK
jgi:prolyl oligopeptidase